MKQQNSTHKERFIIVACLVTIVFGILVTIYVNLGNSTKNTMTVNVSSTPQKEKYVSEFLKISFNLPEGYTAGEKDNTISLNKAGNLITINRSSTDFENLSEHLDWLENKNNITITNKKILLINGINTTEAVIEHPVAELPNNKIYFFYPEEWTVFSISTSSPELYDDLDQIAQSFRYVGGN